LIINSGSQTVKGNTVSRAFISGTQSLTYNKISSGLQATYPTLISHNKLGSLSLKSVEEISDNIIGYEQSYGGSQLHVSGDNLIIRSNTMYCGLIVDGSTATISNNSITFATVDEYSSQEISVLSVSVSESAVISNNNITANVGYIPDFASLGMRPDHGPFYVDYGISVSGNTEVSRNLVSGCPKTSIRIFGSGNIIEHNTFNVGITVESTATSNIIRYNNIQGGLTLRGSQNIDAANNWWGTTNASAIDELIHDNDEDFNLGEVTYTPFLTAPDPQAMPDTNMPVPSPVVSTPNAAPTTVPNQNHTNTPNPGENSQNTAKSTIDLVGPAIIALIVGGSVAFAVVLIILRKNR